MKQEKFHSKSDQDTIAFGERLAKQLKPGAILCLSGDLGTGKTTLTKGLAKGLGNKVKDVHSPTFTLMNIYEDGKWPVYHFDLYRLDNPQAINSVEYDEFLYGEGISVIEWAERLGAYAPKEYIAVRLKHSKDGGRDITVNLKR